MNSCRPSALHVESNTPREKTRSSIGTGAACGSAGDVRLLGSVTGRAGVGISARAAVDTSSNGKRHALLMRLAPSVISKNDCDTKPPPSQMLAISDNNPHLATCRVDPSRLLTLD